MSRVNSGFCCRSSDRQKKEDSVKSDRTAGPEEDEYGGSTDEEPEEVQSTPASTLSTRGKISVSEASSVFFTFRMFYTDVCLKEASDSCFCSFASNNPLNVNHKSKLVPLSQTCSWLTFLLVELDWFQLRIGRPRLIIGGRLKRVVWVNTTYNNKLITTQCFPQFNPVGTVIFL